MPEPRTDYVLRRCMDLLNIYGEELSFPFDPFAVCRDLEIGVESVSSAAARSGFSEEYIMSCWGNLDGVAIGIGSGRRIMYNDRRPENRVRFTLCEELAHHILRHTEDRAYLLSNPGVDEADYSCKEREARMAAGMLLCPPGYVLRVNPQLTVYDIMRDCHVSEECALQTRRFYAAELPDLRELYRGSEHSRFRPEFHLNRKFRRYGSTVILCEETIF